MFENSKPHTNFLKRNLLFAFSIEKVYPLHKKYGAICLGVLKLKTRSKLNLQIYVIPLNMEYIRYQTTLYSYHEMLNVKGEKTNICL